MTNEQNQKWANLLEQAINKPGILHKCYSTFYDYSIGNAIAAMFQLTTRGLPCGPIATYKKWQSLGRQVKKGEKAIALCMPVTLKKKDEKTDEDKIIPIFVWRNNWFALAQTDGEDYSQNINTKEWVESEALKTLQIERVPFDSMRQNTQGYAIKNTVSVSPLAVLPHKTLFHELAHVVLKHTAESNMLDDEQTPKSVKEVEAESIAMICCEALGLEGAEYSRGYIQEWANGQTISEKSAQKIFSAADKILKAGTKQQGVEV